MRQADSRELPRKRARIDDITRVFVGQLAYSTNWKSLKDHFSQIGDVDFASVLTKPDGSSKGCGLVSYRSSADAATAASVLHDSILDGRRIQVKLDVDGRNGSNRESGAVTTARQPFLLERTTGEDTFESDNGAGSVRLPPEQITRVFVGSLSFTTTWQMLKDHFRTVGSVEFVSVLQHPDGTSKGCGIVNFLTHDEAMYAVDRLHDTMLDGRQITVKLDVNGIFRERPPPKTMAVSQAQPAAPQQEAGYHLPPDQIRRVFVGSLAFSTNWQKLKDHFSQVGEVEFASVLLNHDRTSKGCAMVNYTSHEDAMMAVELLGGSTLDGRQISVKLDVDGIFKERPAPRSRPRVAQKTDVINQALAAPLAQLQQALESASRPGAPPLQIPQHSQSPSEIAPLSGASPTGANPTADPIADVNWLSLLGQVASTPAAKQIDWPSLILSICHATSTPV